MDISALSKFFAELRLSRRRAVTHVGAGIAGALVAGGARTTAGIAQSATPVAGGSGELLYVQSFGKGSLGPANESGTYTLTLEQGLGETVYFSDRPERIVGTIPTSTFLTVLDATEADPPNAALVAGEWVVVLELSAASLDEGTGTLTYAAMPIDREDVDMQFDQAVSDAPTAVVNFDTCHLFIDSIDACCDPVHRPWCC